ncbi:T cell receptor alpha chain [Pontoporia blainvillei]|nr:T cell receptor alpha chain [Pontoporia blainvillei]
MQGTRVRAPVWEDPTCRGPWPLSLCVRSLCSAMGQTREDSVTQTDGQMTLPEGAALTINCTYSATGYPITFWYVQYPGEGPQVLLKAMKDNEKGTNKEFEATYHRESKSFHLEKASVQDSDSAAYYCALSDTVMGTAGAAEHKLFEWQQGAWRLSVSPFDPLCGTVYGGLSLSLWLIQNSYKFLENKNKERIFPIPNSSLAILKKDSDINSSSSRAKVISR